MGHEIVILSDGRPWEGWNSEEHNIGDLICIGPMPYGSSFGFMQPLQVAANFNDIRRFVQS